jgi:hypothetical protein
MYASNHFNPEYAGRMFLRIVSVQLEDNHQNDRANKLTHQLTIQVTNIYDITGSKCTRTHCTAANEIFIIIASVKFVPVSTNVERIGCESVEWIHLA